MNYFKHKLLYLLPIGNGGMSNTEYRTMFALWCAVKSPLMLGSDLSKVEPTSETFKVKKI